MIRFINLLAEYVVYALSFKILADLANLIQ